MKMKNLIKKFIFITIFSVSLSGCQTVKEGLSSQKKANNADEFLIQKKSPLILPPEYEKLPMPSGSEINNQADINIKEAFNKKYKNKLTPSLTDSNKSLEKNILDKIKKTNVN
tara:strand:- start:2963 stop:3301 length:339 start_codon:yes stop_codon:yes gene_type:complete